MARFLTMNVGATRVGLAEWQQSGSSLTLTAIASEELPASDDAGLLEASLTTALQTMMRANAIKGGPVVITLGGQMVFPRFAKIPPVGGGAFDEQVRLEVESNVPFPIDEIVSDYQITGDTMEGDKAAVIVAAKVEQVSAVTSAALAAGLVPKIVDVAPLAVTNAAMACAPDMSGCNVILDIGAKTTNLILIEDEKVYNRSIPVGGNSIVKDISQKLQIPPDEAKRLLAERGYVALGGIVEDEDELSDRISKICRAVMTRLHAEISRSINFYRSQQGGNAPERLFLTGETSRLPQLDQFFLDSLKVATAYINPFDFVSFGGAITQDVAESQLFSLAEAAGAARRMVDGASAFSINLLPPELVKRARDIKRIPFVAVGCLAVIGALVLGIMRENSLKSIAEARKVVAEEQAQMREGFAERLAKAQAAEKEALEKTDAFQQLLASRSLVLRRLDAVAKSLNRGMWIVEWKEKSPELAEVTVRGWKRAIDRAEEEWLKSNPNDRKTIDLIVIDGLAKQAGVVSTNGLTTIAIENKDTYRDFKLQIPFEPLDPMVAPPKQKKGGRN